MEKKPSQNLLKLLAAAFMALDHIGLCCQPESIPLRVIGRLAMPLYCYLLAAGFCRTRSRSRYFGRIFLLAILSEYPFDLFLFGSFSWERQNVLVTFFFALLLLKSLEKSRQREGLGKSPHILAAIACLLAPEFLRADYGSFGVLLVLLFYMTQNLPHRLAFQAAGLLLLSCFSGSYEIALGPLNVPIEAFSVLSLIPIALCQGRGRRPGAAEKWAFYLFYPAHLLILSFFRF